MGTCTLLVGGVAASTPTEQINTYMILFVYVCTFRVGGDAASTPTEQINTYMILILITYMILVLVLVAATTTNQTINHVHDFVCAL